VTHDPRVAERAHRILRMRDGKIVEETRRGQPPTSQNGVTASPPVANPSVAEG
jgi:ABC-type siderophore export system fused ATPase/permease subunit